MPPRRILMDEATTPHEIVDVGGFQMEIRSEQMGVDLGWLKYVMIGSRYRSHITFRQGDRWLDVGAYLGGFSVIAAAAGCTCFAFEPGPVTFDMLVRNIQRNGLFPAPEQGKSWGIYPYNAALSARHDEQVAFYLNRYRKKAAHSMYVSAGRDATWVKNYHIDSVIQTFGINCIKSDSEGAELEILMGMSPQSWAQIREVTFTYHIAMLKDKDKSKYAALLNVLRCYFPNVEARDPASIGKNWTVNVHCWK